MEKSISFRGGGGEGRVAEEGRGYGVVGGKGVFWRGEGPEVHEKEELFLGGGRGCGKGYFLEPGRGVGEKNDGGMEKEGFFFFLFGRGLGVGRWGRARGLG